MKLLRLQGRKTCDRLLRLGKVWKGKHLHVRYLEGAPRHPSAKPDIPALYVGVLASAKLDKSAVTRNRMRRRCKEALRLVLQESSPTHYSLQTTHSLQLFILPRSSSLRAPFSELQSDVSAFLSSRFHGPKPQAQ